MASTNHTANLGLSQWEGLDAFTREDLNADFRKIDEVSTRTKLFDVTVSETIGTLMLDFSEIDVDSFMEIEIYFDIKATAINKCIRMNSVSSSHYMTTDSEAARSYMLAAGNISRISIAKNRFVHRADGEIGGEFMNRSYFPTMKTLAAFSTGNEKFNFAVGDKVIVWGVRK